MRRAADAQEFELGRSLVADCRHGDCTACGIPGLPNDTKLAPELAAGELQRLLDLDQDRLDAPQTRTEAKVLMRALINHHLGGKPLYTRQMLKELTEK